MPVINNKKVAYTKENVAMARKMANEKMAKVYEAPSREKVMTDTYKRLRDTTPKGEKFQFSIPRYPKYA